jgi:hypothetical protein
VLLEIKESLKQDFLCGSLRASLHTLLLTLLIFFYRKVRKGFTQSAQRVEFIKLLLFPYPELTLKV